MSRTTPFDDDRDGLPTRIATGLAKVGLALKLQAWRAGSERGLNPLQGQLLALLMTDRGGVRPSVLAGRLAVTAPTVSESVAALASKGLVERRPDPDDGRVSLVSLTAKGRAEARHAAGWPDFLTSAVETLSDAEQEVFWKGLMKMIVTLQQRDEAPASPMCLTCVHFRPNAHRDPALPHHCAFVDAPLGHRHLRLECDDHDEAPAEARAATIRAFVAH